MRLATGIPAAILLLCGTSVFAQSADRIWLGGPILTMNDDAMRAEAVAESGGRIVAVGSRADVMKQRGAATQVIDLQGRALLPGFVDAHGHVVMGGVQALAANLLAPPDGEVRDIASLQQTIRDWARANEATIARVKLMIGFGYDNAQLKELRHPTRDDLDAVSKDVPLLIVHQSGHLGVLNSKALELAAVSATTTDPEGGVIRRREGSREPDGVLEETAFFLAIGKLLPAVGPEGMKAFAREGAKLWARFGYTTAQEGRSTPQVAAIMKQVAAEGGFAIDVVTYPDVLVDRDYIKTNLSPQWAAENGVQIITHANGERASDLLIAAHGAAQARFPKARELRPVLIHGQFLREDQLDSYKRLGVIPSLFPMHTFYWGDWHLDHTVGPEAGENISPTGWTLKRGMIFTSHHDAPAAFPDSMRVLDATVTRRARGSGRIVGAEQRVDVITALKAMTIWPAYQHFVEKTKGSLEPGKLADFVILSKDPTAVEPTTLADIKVTETVKEGQTVFRLAAAKAGPGAGGTAAGEGLSRLLGAMAHAASPSPAAGGRNAGSGMASDAAPASGQQGSCPSDLMVQLADAMASAAGRAAQ